MGVPKRDLVAELRRDCWLCGTEKVEGKCVNPSCPYSTPPIEANDHFLDDPITGFDQDVASFGLDLLKKKWGLEEEEKG